MSVMSAVTDRIPTGAATADINEGFVDPARLHIDNEDEQWVTSITESKGSTGVRTVGIAAFQPSSATVILTQLNDSQTYIKTVHTLSVSSFEPFWRYSLAVFRLTFKILSSTTGMMNLKN